MLVLIGTLLYLNLRQIVQHKRLLISGLIVSLAVALIVIICFRGFTGDVVFGLLVLGYVIGELYLLRTKQHLHSWRWALAFSIFLLGFIFWLCDASHFYCANIGLFNGRAIFHYTSATTIYLLFVFYRLQPNKMLDKPLTL